MFISSCASSSHLESLLGDWLSKFAVPGSGHVEIEAKIGVLLDKNTGRRINLPIQTEAVLNDAFTSNCRFESDIPAALHKHMNKLLNNEVSLGRLQYRHTKTLDKMYRNSISPDKVRVTVDESGNVIECIVKRRLSDLHIHFPQNHFDIRISVNEEIKSSPPYGTPVLERKKDRISYTAESSGLKCQLDLTQVKQTGESMFRHELEIEVLNLADFASQKDLASPFLSCIRNILNATN